MKKFIKGNSNMQASDDITGLVLTVSSVEVVTKSIVNDGTNTDSEFALTVASLAEAGTVAEALVDEINYGKEVVIDLENFHPLVTAVTFTANRT